MDVRTELRTTTVRRANIPSEKEAQKSFLQRNWRTFFIGVTIAVDAVATVSAGATAYKFRQMIPNYYAIPLAEAVSVVIPYALVFVVIALLTGLYRSTFRAPYAEQFRGVVKAYTYSTVVVFFGLYLEMGKALFPLRFTVVFLALIPLFLGVLRWMLTVANRNLQKRGYGRENTMMVNGNGIGAQLLERFTIFPELGYSVKAFVCGNASGESCDPSSCLLRLQFARMMHSQLIPRSEQLPCYALNELETAIDNHRIERIVVPFVKSFSENLPTVVEACENKEIKLKLVSRESEELLRFSRLTDIAGISLYSPPTLLTQKLKTRLKRVFDICMSSVLILICLPIFLLVALAILIEDGRPVIFRQRRSSAKGGRSFHVLKFRSMVKDAETQQAKLYRLNQAEEGLFMLENDPRVTRVGRWIRRFSLDELPQLFNVLRGEMSLVGPRPLSQGDLASIPPSNDFTEYHSLRDQTLPGMTGLWQICGRRNIPFREMFFLDLYYIENQSVIFDLEILFATIPVVLFGRGAY